VRWSPGPFPSCRREYGVSRFPFETDSYRYAQTSRRHRPPRFDRTNVRVRSELRGGQLVDVARPYAEELALRRSILGKRTTPHRRRATTRTSWSTTSVRAWEVTTLPQGRSKTSSRRRRDTDAESLVT